MPMTWNDQSDAKLLVAILHTTSAKLDYAAIAEYMGPECTKVAVQIRITRLKKQVHDASNPTAAVAASDEGSAPATPEKRKKGAKAGSKNNEGGVKKRPAKKVKRGEDEEAMGTETEESG
ncbi:uncharacterized protein ASPGLDRAFT_1267919 [Aspergillus glaucus CBS 516.65]|uniref:AT hook motif protein n=1 Tax=Aspergillus glaucus CBS 516.65 TaxID=1160497 RepID=A0A1L9VS99_ASPGL|nr:hypothetical protein ASPGLDRAFT_1267919 [Aspergillus glaucus CBS 516.65]OJJ86770.1 hypothetical protein ASPGLDRAFT_1267919 [Aspergillus glaucus CBS 516.65]